MDDQRFDTLVRALAAGVTRRGALAMLAGLAGLQAAETAEAKPGRKRRGASKKGRQKQGASAEKKEDKVTICHRTKSKKNPFVEIEVAQSAIPAHEAHGDTIDPDFDTDPENCGGCGISCDDDDPCTTDTCDDGDCVNTPIVCNDNNPCTDDACVGGDCVFTPVAGRECNDGDPCTENDTCNRRGNCVGRPIVCPDSDQVCVGGNCVCSPDLPACDPPFARDPATCDCVCPITSCPDGEILDEDACECIPEPFFCDEEFTCAPGEEPVTCGLPGSDCLCGLTVEGFDRCGNNFVCGTMPACSSTEECEAQFGPGFACRAEGFGCCPGSPGVCRPPCGTEVATIAARGDGQTDSGR